MAFQTRRLHSDKQSPFLKESPRSEDMRSDLRFSLRRVTLSPRCDEVRSGGTGGKMKGATLIVLLFLLDVGVGKENHLRIGVIEVFNLENK